MKTPHINAEIGDFAKTVLMPGDPLRSEFIAKNFLSEAVLVNNVRGVQGYTGNYKGKRVSVMASGMGMPSMGIYSYELFNLFGVDNIIRVGSAGALREDVRVRDVVLGMGACTDSNYLSSFDLPYTFAPICSFELLSRAAENAKKLALRYHIGNLFTSDAFYSGTDNSKLIGANMGTLAVEMEAAALYANAARAGKNALAICTISDSLVTGEATSADERQTTFTQMIELALETAE